MGNPVHVDTDIVTGLLLPISTGRFMPALAVVALPRSPPRLALLSLSTPASTLLILRFFTDRYATCSNGKGVRKAALEDHDPGLYKRSDPLHITNRKSSWLIY